MADERQFIQVEMPLWEDEEYQRDLRRQIADQGRKVVEVFIEPPYYVVVTVAEDEAEGR